MMLWRRVDRPSFLAMIGKEMCNRIRTKKLPRLAVSAVSDHLQELEAELQVICHLPRPARASPHCGRRAPLIPPFPTAERFAALGQLGAAPRAHTVAPPSFAARVARRAEQRRLAARGAQHPRRPPLALSQPAGARHPPAQSRVRRPRMVSEGARPAVVWARPPLRQGDARLDALALGARRARSPRLDWAAGAPFRSQCRA